MISVVSGDSGHIPKQYLSTSINITCGLLIFCYHFRKKKCFPPGLKGLTIRGNPRVIPEISLGVIPRVNPLPGRMTRYLSQVKFWI